MEKRIWAKPELNEVAFAANEYCASSCGTDNFVYNFTCDAGGGEYGGVWVEADEDPNNLQEYDEWVLNDPNHPVTGGGHWDYGDEKLTNTYHACGITHKASNKDQFLDGWFKNWTTGLVTKVKIWRGPKGNNVHCTENLDMSSWTTEKS